MITCAIKRRQSHLWRKIPENKVFWDFSFIFEKLIKISTYNRIRGCRHFIGLNGNSHFTPEFYWIQSAERQLNSFISIPNHILFNLFHKILQRKTLPWTIIEHFVFHPPEESLASRIVWWASFPGHGSSEPCIIDPLNPAKSSVMAASIRMKNRLCVLWQRVDCTIKHSVYQLCIWFTADIPCYRNAVIAVDNGRDIPFLLVLKTQSRRSAISGLAFQPWNSAESYLAHQD